MEELVVKYKKITTVYFSGRVKTEDVRYRIKISKNKLIKWLLKNNFQFSVGINDGLLVDNLNYIEVWSNSFFKENHFEKNELIKRFIKKYSVKKGNRKWN